MPIINRFDGGLVTGVDSVYLNNTQAAILLDANIEQLGLTSASKPKKLGLADNSFYQFPVLDSEPEEFHVTSSVKMRSYAEFQGSLCYSDGGPICQMTTGEMDGVDFKWTTMGVDAAEGSLVAYALELKHIAGASTTLIVDAFPGSSHIVANQIRYRIVDTADNNTVYVHTIKNNTGYSTVDWILPATNGLKVYREILDSYGNYTDKYLLVYTTEPGDYVFTDGLQPLNDEYEFLEPTEAPEGVEGHRLSVVGDKAYSSPYTLVVSESEAILSISRLAILNKDDSWDTELVNISLRVTDFDSVVGIASTFVLGSQLYIMARLNNKFSIFKSDGVEVFTSSAIIDEEFFKCTTVEHSGVLYFFNPRDGQTANFTNNKFVVLDNIPKFPYATASNSVFTVKQGDNEVYALINDRHNANVRNFTLPDMTMGFVAEERIDIPYIRGLGGSSGSDFTEGDFRVFPVHGGLIKFSPTSRQVVSDLSTDTLSSQTESKFSMFGKTGPEWFRNLASDHNGYNVEFNGINPYVNLSVRGVPLTPEWFNEETLTGTYIYNVAQKTADGSSEGPIMDVDSNPVGVHKGHIRVDVTGITHTNPLRLYRTGGYLTRFTMVEDVDIVDTYVDNRSDVTIALGRNGKVDYVYGPPEGLKWLTEHRGMLFGSVGNTLYWSQPGKANSWDELNSFIIIDREITGLGSAGNGLVILMKGRIKLLMGDGVHNFVLRTTSNEKGTLDGHSVQSVMNGVLFFSEDGLCFTDGSQIKELSYDILGPRRFDAISSCATNRSYYAIIKAFTTDLLHKSKIIIRYDFGKQPVFSLLSADTLDGLGVVNGRLAHSSQRLLYDTLGEDKRTFNYRSGNITENAPTMIKEWDRVRLVGDFRGVLFIHIDDSQVVKHKIYGQGCNIHIPKSMNKGKAIAFELVGVGFVASIEYSITARKVSK